MVKKNTQAPARLLTSREAAAFLHISESALRTARSRGYSPPYFKINGRVRYSQGDLMQWLRARRK